ncbi:MAG: glycine zipper 2TM domain-containing protein [Caulobacter sp.]|nr:glycine zipper 2TM domain-containing protein [Caulobacter sp.]
MKTRSTFAGLACVTLLAGLAAVPTAASAQAYPTAQAGEGYSYDACQRSRTNRGTGGALIGAGVGAVTGSNIAGGGNRTEGAILGSILGAVIGAKVGTDSAACQPGTYTEGYAPEGQDSYAQGGTYGYQDSPAGYQQGSYDDRYGDDDGYGDGYARPVADTTPSADNCSLAESPIYLPDGRVQKRFVRVCRDADGRYQVVD